MFDPYRKWLGIPEDSRPPTHYQLLGLAPTEQDPEVINAAVVRQSAYVRNFQSGKFADHATKILNEISAAKACLLDAAKRAEYDAQMRRDEAKAPASKAKPAKVAVRRQTVTKPARAARPVKKVRSAAPVAAAPAPLVDPLLEQLAGTPSALGTSTSPYWLGEQRKRSPATWQIAVGIGASALVLLGVILLVTSGNNDDKLANANLPGNENGSSGDGNASSGNSAATANGGTANGGTANGTATNSSNGTTAGSNSATKNGFQPVNSANSAGTDAKFAASASGNPSAGNADSDSSNSDTSNSNTSSGAAGDAPRVEASWGDSTQLGIPAPAGDAEIVFASQTGPYVAIGAEVFNLKTGEASGKIDTEPERRELAALAPDGKHFAMGRSELKGAVELYDCESGELVHELRIKGRNPDLEFVDFPDNDHLVTAFREFSDSLCQVWDIQTGKLQYELPTESFESKEAALSPDGKFLAVATTSDGVLVYELKKRKLAARLMPPKDNGGGSFLMCSGLSFSADSQEIVAVADFGNRLLGWSGNAKVIFDYRSDVNLQSSWAGAFGYGGRAVEPVPDGSGWLLNGHLLFERSSRRVVWTFKSQGGGEDRFHFLDADHLIVTQGGNRNRALTSVEIPRKAIHASVAALNAGAEAYLSPKTFVSIQVQAGQIRTGSPQQAAVEVERVISDRLKAAGLQVGPGGPSVMVAKYSEFPETIQRLVTDSFGRPIFDARGIPSTQQVQTTRAELQLSLVPVGQSDSIWSAQTSATADPSFGSKGGTIFDSVANQLKGVPIPYFIPKDNGLPSLPVVSEL